LAKDKAVGEYFMNLGNIGLWLVAAFALWAGWIVFDMSRPVSGGGSASMSMAEVRNATQPVLVEFYADWCGPCREVGPVVEALAGELRGKAKVVRINVDHHPDAAQENGIRGIPAFIAYKNGRETGREVGAIPKSRMLQLLGL
jgi:thioredoxin 1